MPETGRLTSTAWGYRRLSQYGTASNWAPTRTALTVPPTNESGRRHQIPGPHENVVRNFDFSDPSIVQELHAAFEARTADPWVDFVRGTAGGMCWIHREASILEMPDPQSVDQVSIRSLAWAPGELGGGRFQANGMLFDHSIAHPAGVTAAVDGAAVNVGALSASQSAIVYYASLDHPAPVAGTLDAKLQSAADSGFTSGVTDEVTFASITTSAAYQVAILAGAITNAWWRLSITGVGGGTYYPVCCMAIY